MSFFDPIEGKNLKNPYSITYQSRISFIVCPKCNCKRFQRLAVFNCKRIYCASKHYKWKCRDCGFNTEYREIDSHKPELALLDAKAKIVELQIDLKMAQKRADFLEEQLNRIKMLSKLPPEWLK